MSEPSLPTDAARPPSPPPLGLLAELTHRCPLQCPYCSNPLALERPKGELATDEWRRVLGEAADLGVLQLHLSGGEPTLRPDLEAIVAHAAQVGLYSNLITSGVALTEARLAALAHAGLAHVQISLQDTVAASADRLAHYQGAHARKLALAAAVRKAGLALTLNAPLHRHNVARTADFIELAVAIGARRLEVAHVQYYGWALANRAALMPTRAEVDASVRVVEAARARLKGILTIDLVLPDYYATRPKPCMGGWGRGIINVTPSGLALPCHAAQSIPGLVFDSVRARSLQEIWETSPAFAAFRGTGWMREPCLSCDRRERDWGGCRCQAFAVTGDARNADPACALSSHHADFTGAAAAEAASAPPEFRYRRFSGAPAVTVAE
ncbi:MAG: pyrroloquinoline quinone biosynthesis protein PqqE [Hyphomicrobiaceae bacterium]|nr:pyrroloquinoline quinone biosynthesis protein PqqE [Hyphomicrobiaceae bacterium]